MSHSCRYEIYDTSSHGTVTRAVSAQQQGLEFAPPPSPKKQAHTITVTHWYVGVGVEQHKWHKWLASAVLESGGGGGGGGLEERHR
jgi:hypothetical protein